MPDPTATNTATTTPHGTPDAIATTIHTYRMAARLVRSKMRHPNPLARGTGALILIRNRAMTIIHAAAPAPLADAIDDEEILLMHIGYLRERGLTTDGALAALDSARARRREILYHFLRGTLAPEHTAPRAR